MGEVVIVTGANSGIGYGLVERLIDLRRGGGHAASQLTVVLAGRSVDRLRAAISSLQSRIDEDVDVKLEMLQVDLSDTRSVLNACLEFRSRHDRLHTLFLNAGIMNVQGLAYWNGIMALMRSPVDFFHDVSATVVQKRGELTRGDRSMGLVFAANVFGHYVMMRRLMELDVLAADCRVVWTGSMTAGGAVQWLRWSDIQGIESAHAYESSKLVTDLLSAGLNEEFEAAGLGVRSFVVDPGVVSTNIVGDGMHWFMKYCLMIPVMFIASFLLPFITYTAKNAACGHVHVACGDVVDPDVKYCSRFDRLRGKSYVVGSPLLAASSESECDKSDGILSLDIPSARRVLDIIKALYAAKVLCLENE
eukprot:Partr_v1_DN25621_c0_g1_i1_m4735 putative Hydroxysteroid (17-beta) dehydrogenase 7